MKQLFTLLFLSLCLLMACKGPKGADPGATPPPENPAAFEDKKSGEVSILRKSSYSYRDDMVDELYNELLEKDSALNMLEKAIGRLDEQRSDSSQPFQDYDRKNETYYSSVQSHLQTITDSGLKQRMKILIDNSLAGYKGAVSKHHNLVELLKAKDIEISNLHVVLKIVKTLPMAEKFQKENMPSTNQMVKMLATYIRLIRQADTLSKQGQ